MTMKYDWSVVNIKPPTVYTWIGWEWVFKIERMNEKPIDWTPKTYAHDDGLEVEEEEE